MSHSPADLTPLPDLPHGAALAGPVRTRKPVSVDLLPPCNARCPAGENIQAWLAATQAGEHKRAWISSTGPWPPATGRWSATTPVLRDAGRNPFLLDSHRPRPPLSGYTGRELRYRILARTDPEAAERLSKLAQQQVSQRWATYEEMAAHSPEWFPASGDGDPAGPENEGSSR